MGVPRKGSHSFASGLNGYKLFWIFFIGCFVGVVIETLWCLVMYHKLESRSGLIYGPFNPVYGFGAVVMTLCLYQLNKKRDLWIFAGGLVLGGAFEYLCSWVQEYLVGTISWEYSYLPFNLNGRTNLLYSFFWGLLALVWVKSLYPQMSRLIERIPNQWGKGITWVLVVFMALNMGLSAMAVSRQTERHSGAPAQSGIDRFLDRHYPDELLWRVYPNMLSARDKSSVYGENQ